MKRWLWLVVLVALVGAGWGVYRWLHVGDVRQIRRVIREAAAVCSWSGEGGFGRLTMGPRLDALCTEDVEVNVDFGGVRVLRGRERVREGAVMARASVEAFRVTMGELVVKLDSDGDGASAQAVTTLRSSGWTEPLVQEFRFRLRKVAGGWRIAQVVPVQGFGQ